MPKAELDLMFKTARTQGLGYWMDYGLKVHIVDHTNCTYPPVDEKLTQYFDTVLKWRIFWTTHFIKKVFFHEFQWRPTASLRLVLLHMIKSLELSKRLFTSY